MGNRYHKRDTPSPKWNFLLEFNLGNTNIMFYKKSLQRFENRITSMVGDNEGTKHYFWKHKIHQHIWLKFYQPNKEFYVTTELEQKLNPFRSFINENVIYFTLDICAIRTKDYRIFDIEIDGREHATGTGIRKARYRDAMLKERYGIDTLRIDYEQYNEPPYKLVEEFINQT